MCLKPAPTRAASTHACSQHPRSQSAPTLAVSTHACSQPTLAGSIHVCRQHPRLQAAPTLVATMHACSQHPTRAAAISPANAHPYHRDALHFFSPLTLCPYSQLNVLIKGSSSLANALFPDSLGIQRLFPVQALFLRPPHLFLLWLSRSRCPAPHVLYRRLSISVGTH